MKDLSDESLIKLKEMLMKDEGFRSKPYKDSVGKLTIGFGRNLEDNDITISEAIYLLNNDIEKSIYEVNKVISNFDSLTDNRKIVLICMIFNMGLPKFLTFKKMISAIINNDNNEVTKQMLQSNWADQVGDRARRLSQLWIKG